MIKPAPHLEYHHTGDADGEWSWDHHLAMEVGEWGEGGEAGQSEDF